MDMSNTLNRVVEMIPQAINEIRDLSSTNKTTNKNQNQTTSES